MLICLFLSNLIQSVLDKHTFSIAELEPIAFNYDYGFFRHKTWHSLCWRRHAHSRLVILLWEIELECLNNWKFLGTQNILFTQQQWENSLWKWSTCLLGLVLLSPSDKADWQLSLMLTNFWFTSADHHTISSSKDCFNMRQIAFPATTGRQLGLLVWNRIQDNIFYW